MSQPLEGIRVIDCASAISAPAACALLADMGAEVIKVESPAGQDRVRARARVRATPGPGPDQPIAMAANNHNKKGVALDLKKPGGREALYRLIRKADIFCTNFPPNIIEDLGIDYPTLQKVNPRLVYGRLTSYGPQGPDSDKRGVDPTAQARSGLMYAMGDRDWKEPVLLSGALSDQMTAVTLAMGVLAALASRNRTGKGDLVDVSLLGTMIYGLTGHVNAQLMHGRTSARHSRTRARNALANFYECGDGKWILLADPNPDRYWGDLADVLGIGHLTDDPNFATAPARREHYLELIALLDDVFKKRSREDWVRTFEENRVGFVYAPVNDFPDVVNDPQVLRNEYIIPVDLPGLRGARMVGLPIAFASGSPAPRRPMPDLGAHNEEVLRTIAGYSDEELAQLKSAGAIP